MFIAKALKICILSTFLSFKKTTKTISIVYNNVTRYESSYKVSFSITNFVPFCLSPPQSLLSLLFSFSVKTFFFNFNMKVERFLFTFLHVPFSYRSKYRTILWTPSFFRSIVHHFRLFLLLYFLDDSRYRGYSGISLSNRLFSISFPPSEFYVVSRPARISFRAYSYYIRFCESNLPDSPLVSFVYNSKRDVLFAKEPSLCTKSNSKNW